MFVTFRVIVSAVFALTLLVPAVSSAKQPLLSKGSVRPEAVPGEVIVAFQPGHSAASLSTPNIVLRSRSNALGKTRAGVQFARLRLSEGVSVSQAMTTLRDDPVVLAVAPNYLNYPMLIPSDPSFGQVWGLRNTGQTISSPVYSTNNPGNVDADVDADEAWDVTVGSNSVVIAVIDTGVDYTHPDLSGAMWDATGATFGGASYSSNFFGWDFADNDPDTYPLNSAHGTHVAGTIAATGNNSIGIPGVAFGSQIMALKVFPDKGGGASDADIISAINYAVENGADVINMSLGRGGAESSIMTTAVANAVNAGTLIVVAAGNGGGDGIGDNNDTTPQWPSNYASHASTSGGVISVLATDQRDQRATFSNFGTGSVTIGAPGVNVLSTVTGRTTLQSETLASVTAPAWTQCSLVAQTATCMNNTVFDRGGSTNDCDGASCRWGVYKPTVDSGLIYGDNDTVTLSYANNIDGTIVSSSIDVSGTQKAVLRYVAFWDLECTNDYVDIEIWDGSAWQRLTAPDFNVESNGAACPSPTSRTHTGRTYQVYGPLEVAHDISAFTAGNAALQVRFRFVTNGNTNSSALVGGFFMTDVFLDAQATNYSTSYQLFNGTSMASPMVAGVAALVKSRFPGYTAANLKQAVVNTGDTVTSLATRVSSGRRVNAHRALTVPVFTSLSPSTIMAGNSGFTLTVDGVNFENGAVVRWNGSNRPTTFVSATQLTAAISASDVATMGAIPVTIHNPISGFTSSARNFTISPSTSTSLNNGGNGGGGGGGGCALGAASRVDPTLWMLLLASIGVVLRRRRT